VSLIKRALREVLTDEEMQKLVRSYDMIGDVLLVKLHPDLRKRKNEIGHALKKAFPHARVIAAVPLFGRTHDTFRTRDLDIIFGEERTETIHKESGCVFKVDIRNAFFSPRLAYERMRVARKVREGETVVNMFAGVGCFSIIIAKVQPNVRKIYSIDINPVAYHYMCENIRLNNVEDRVVPILGDARDVLKDIKDISRVLMPLPDKAHEFLADVVKLPNVNAIHYYDVASSSVGMNRREMNRGAPDGVSDRVQDAVKCASGLMEAAGKVGEEERADRRKKEGYELFREPYKRAMSIIRAEDMSVSVCVEEMRVVRSVGPRKYHVVIDFRLKREGMIEGEGDEGDFA